MSPTSDVKHEVVDVGPVEVEVVEQLSHRRRAQSQACETTHAAHWRRLALRR